MNMMRSTNWAVLLASTCAMSLLTGCAGLAPNGKPDLAQRFGETSVVPARDYWPNSTYPLAVGGNSNDWVSISSIASSLWEREHTRSEGVLHIATSHDNSATWSSLTPMFADPVTTSDRDAFPLLANCSDGTWIALWLRWRYDPNDRPKMDVAQKLQAATLLTSSSRDRGETWSAPRPIKLFPEERASWRFEPRDLATDSTSTLVCAGILWDSKSGSELEAGRVALAVSHDSGATWRLQRMMNNELWEMDPRVTTDGKGTWAVIWRSPINRIGDMEALLSVSTDNAQTWSQRPVLSRMPVHQVDIAFGRRGVLVALVLPLYKVNNNLKADGAAITRSTNLGSTWDELHYLSMPRGAGQNDWIPSGPNPVPPDFGFYYTNLASDGHGRIVAMWYSSQAPGGSGQGDSVATMSTDNGRTWSLTRYVNLDAPESQWGSTWPTIAYNGERTWVVQWFSNGHEYYSLRSRAIR